MNKKHKLLLTGASVVALGLYRGLKGKGAFNKIKYAREYEAIKKYIDANYPGASFSNIEAVGSGWSTVMTYYNDKYLLNLTRTDDGCYIFNETKIEE